MPMSPGPSQQRLDPLQYWQMVLANSEHVMHLYVSTLIKPDQSYAHVARQTTVWRRPHGLI